MLEVRDSASVADVGSSTDEPKVSGLVSLVNVGSVELKLWPVPSVEGEEVPEKGGSVLAPGFVDVNPAGPIMDVSGVFWVVAALEAGRDSVEQSGPVVGVGADVGVTPVGFLGSVRRFLCAWVAARRMPASEIVRIDGVDGFTITRAGHENASDSAPGTEMVADHA